VRSLPAYPISLPASSRGPTTCTVYEPDYATQIVVDSLRLNVRAECELWSANQTGVGYLWGYEQAAVTADVRRLCTLTDPHREMTASVIEDTGFVPLSAAQRARGGSACAGIRASGWTDAHRRAAHLSRCSGSPLRSRSRASACSPGTTTRTASRTTGAGHP
jgi:hypothetical protein